MALTTGSFPDFGDIRDRLYSSYRAFITHLPFRAWWPRCWKYAPSVDLRTTGFWPPIFDQGSLDCCIENAICSILSFMEAKEGRPGQTFSRLFVFFNSRSDKTANVGTTPRTAMKAVANWGACSEALWPYDQTKFSVAPPPEAYQAALPLKGIEYHRLEVLDHMLHTLDQGYPFHIGLSVCSEIWALTKDNPILQLPAPDEKPVGGHTVAVIGYDLSKKAFLCANSWGTGYCQDGFFWLSFDYAADPFLAFSLWTIRYAPAPA